MSCSLRNFEFSYYSLFSRYNIFVKAKSSWFSLSFYFHFSKFSLIKFLKMIELMWLVSDKIIFF